MSDIKTSTKYKDSEDMERFERCKIMLFTHTDLDGVGCDITLRTMLSYNDDIVTKFCDYNNVNDKILEFIKSDEIKKYSKDDWIMITDISVSKELAEKLDNINKNQVNILLLDHHETALWLNKYSWAMVKTEDNINNNIEKTCGTRMVFDYAIPFSKSHLSSFQSIHETNKKIYLLEHFVEIVRKYDTWLWNTKYNDEIPKKYNDLLYILGRNKFYGNIRNKIEYGKDMKMHLSKQDNLLLELEEEKIKRYVDKKEKSIIKVSEFSHKFGVIFCENYVSQVGNTLSERNPDLDFIMMINLDDMKVNLRTTRKDVKVNDFAKQFGGGGHPRAAGFTLSKLSSSSKLLKTIFDQINAIKKI